MNDTARSYLEDDLYSGIEESDMTLEKRKTAGTMLTEVDFEYDFDTVSDEEVAEDCNQESERNCEIEYEEQVGKINYQIMLKESMERLRPHVTGITKRFDTMPINKRFEVYVRLRKKGGIAEEFAKTAVAYETYLYGRSIIKRFGSYICESNRDDAEQTCMIAVQTAFPKYDPKRTSRPLQYFGQAVYEQLFYFVSREIFGRTVRDAKGIFVVGRIMQDIMKNGIPLPSVGDVALQNAIRMTTEEGILNVGKIKYYMTQVNTPNPKVSIYVQGEDDSDELDMLEHFDTDYRYGDDYEDPSRLAINSEMAAQIYKILKKLSKDERDAKAFILNRYLGKTIASITESVYQGEIQRDAVARRLNNISAAVQESTDLKKLRYGVNELKEVETEKIATIDSTDHVLDDLCGYDIYDPIAKIKVRK